MPASVQQLPKLLNPSDMKKLTFVLLCLLLGGFGSAAAQVVESGYSEVLLYPAKVQLLDAKGKPVPDVEVIIFTPEETIAQSKTDAQGKAAFLGIVEGEYDLIFKLANGKNVMFDHQWFGTKEQNEHIYRLSKKQSK